MKKSLLSISGGIVIASLSVGTMVVPASAAEPLSTTTNGVTSTAAMTATFTHAQWRVIERNARAAGDKEAAAYAAAQADPNSIRPMGLGGLALKAIKYALKYGYDLLPKAVKPYAGKVLNVLDAIEEVAEYPITMLLWHNGVPYDHARLIAQWIVTFAV
ncbi:hypothetical protein [Microbacterium karelineae]|uniref:hypothetical protein n=1 Tax=Microbacterium karelineae TaxID=2654283 RepID=UPI0012E9E5EC|nr:hypothetical protein [Microbacterium karelineae]